MATIGRIVLRERGAVPRGMKRVWNRASAQAYASAAQHFHDVFRDRRFTHAHAEAAGYKKRKGEGQPRGSKAWKRSYTGRKFAKYGHTRPLEWSGKTRDKIATQYRVASSSKWGRVIYSGASKFSLRHPKSQIRMQEEFRRLLPEEEVQLGEVYDRRLDQLMGEDDSSTTVRVV